MTAISYGALLAHRRPAASGPLATTTFMSAVPDRPTSTLYLTADAGAETAVVDQAELGDWTTTPTVAQLLLMPIAYLLASRDRPAGRHRRPPNRQPARREYDGRTIRSHRRTGGIS